MSVGTPTYRTTRPAPRPSRTSPRFAPDNRRAPARRAPTISAAKIARRAPKIPGRYGRIADAVLSLLQPGQFVPAVPRVPTTPPGYVLQSYGAPTPSPDPVNWPWLGVDRYTGSTLFGPWSSTPHSGVIIGINDTKPRIENLPRSNTGVVWNRLALANIRRNANPEGNYSGWYEYYFYRPNSGVAIATYPDFFPPNWFDPRTDPLAIPIRMPRYRPVANQRLAPLPRPGQDFGFHLPSAPRPTLRPARTTGRPRGREAKMRMSAAMYAVILGVNALGEMIEWVDILAALGGYPFGRWRNGRSPWVDKAYWLFMEGGLGYVEADEFAMAALWNAIEDRFYGGLGKLSKGAARNLNRQVGFQTGLAL